ncbi:MAG: bi-domain-containing oxidoreductase [Nitrospirota bacterium]
MKQVVQNYRTGALKVDDVPTPPLHHGGLLVANRVSLISPGTEKSTVAVAHRSLVGKAMERPDMVRKVLHHIHRDGLVPTVKRVFERLDTPAALGYSCAGTALRIGKAVDRFSAGDRVACAGQQYASHAEVVYVPKNLCVRIPDGVDFEEAAFVTLGAIALQGVRQADPRLGERVAVIGLGLLGQLTVQLLKAAGCSVLGSDLDQDRLALAQEFGADAVVRPPDLIEAALAFSEGRGVDAVIITAGTKENGPVQVAGEIARQKGRVVVVGAVGMTLPREPYYRKELEFRLSMSYGPGRYDKEFEEKGRDYPFGYVRWTETRNMEAFLDLIRQRKVDVKRLVTHRFPIEQAEEAYRLLMDNTVPCLGLVITYPSNHERPETPVIAVSPVQPAASVVLGLIGAGQHVKDALLPALAGARDVSIRAVCTASGVTAKALADRIRAAYCTGDPQAVLADDAVNAVLIGTRHDTHADLVVRALEAGKHVFVEKPLCLTQEELDRIAAVYRERADQGLQLMVGLNRRFSRHAAEARALFRRRVDPLVMVYRVNAGAIPPTHWIQDPDVGGGRVLGEICHFVDYLQALCGALPVSVHARRIGRHSSGITDDQCVISLAFADGSIGTIVYTAGGDTVLPKERVEVFGNGRALTMDDFVRTDLYAQGRKRTFKSGERDKGFGEEMAQFVEAITRGKPPLIPFEQVWAVTRACLLAAQSLRTGAVYDV